MKKKPSSASRLRSMYVWFHDHPLVAVILTLCTGLFVRLILSPEIENHDAVLTQGWMESAARLGVPTSYDQQVNGGMLPVYPPVSMYLFAITGWLYTLLVSPDYQVLQPLHLIFVKLPAITAEVGIQGLLFLLLASWKRPWMGVAASALYAVHPAAIYNSTMWGQTDAIYSSAVLLTVFAYVRGRHIAGAMLAVLACLIKPQALAFLPLFFFLTPLRPKVILASLVGIVALVLLIYLPFILHGNVVSALRGFHVFDLAGETHISWRAYNLWWAILGERAHQLPGSTLTILGITYRTAGMLLFGGTVLGTLMCLCPRLRGDLRKPENAIALLLAASITALAFFLLNAEMHERYAYPFIALALPLACINLTLSRIYIGVSVLYLLNMLGVFPYSPIDIFLFAHIPHLSIIIATLQLVFLLLLLPFVLSRRYQFLINLTSPD